MTKIPLRREPGEQRIRLNGRDFIARGLEKRRGGDFYHQAMTASWPAFFLGAAIVYLGSASLFALVFWSAALAGFPPIANVQTGGLLDHFYFSVETLATVGYGDMHPQNHFGHIVATLEIFLGTMSIAILTGLVFSRFSRPRARILFTRPILIGRYDGRLMLMVRMANARHNLINGATAKLWMTRRESNAEGTPFRRFHELTLLRRENPLFALSWTLFHVIDETSMLHGMDQGALEAADAGFIVTVTGLDETSNDDMHARHSWTWRDLRWNERYADIITPDADGTLVLDYAQFHATEPVRAAASA